LLKGSIKAKERGTPIIYFDIKEKEVNGVKDKYVLVKYSTIFNLEQTTLELPVVETVAKEFTPIEVAEQIVTNYVNGPKIEFKYPQTYYVPSTDTVNMLKRENYLTPEHYYYSLYHELSHSTGHHSRLNREGISSDSSHSKHSYSYEELIAELSSSFLLNAIGLDFIQQHSSYISGWLTVLKNDSKFVIKAASEAERSANFILGERPSVIQPKAEVIPQPVESSVTVQ
jgi:antirestriction protein ArdC